MLSPAQRKAMERALPDEYKDLWLLKYLPHPPTPLQDWADWLILAEGLTALYALVQRVPKPPAWMTEANIGRTNPCTMNFGEWLQAVLTADNLTVGSVPMNALHASTRQVSDGYLVVVKQGLLRFLRELVTIYEFAGSTPKNDDEVARRLKGLLDAHAQYLSSPLTGFPPETDVFAAVTRLGAMAAGLSVDEMLALIASAQPTGDDRRREGRRDSLGARAGPRTPLGLTRDILAPLFVVLHELAHIYHGDADLSDADTARLEAEYAELTDGIVLTRSELLSYGPHPSAIQGERHADSEALQAIIGIQQLVRRGRPTNPLAASSPDINLDLQLTALESAYLSMTALYLVQETILPRVRADRVPDPHYLDPNQRLIHLGMAAVYDASIPTSVVEEVEQLVRERLTPAIRRVLGS